MVKGKKKTKYGLIPQEWKVLTFSKCADIRDGTHDTPQPVLSGYPLVTSKNLKNGKIDLTDTYNISSDDYAKINQRSAVEQGDILYAMIGTIGNPVLIEFQPKFAIKNVALFKPYDSSIGRYLKYYLQCSYFLKEINDAQNGSNQNFISLSAFRNMQIIIPDIDERAAIAEALSDMDGLISSLQKLIEKKKAIKQGAMQELLTGKKRLPGFRGEWSKSPFVDLFEFLPTNVFTREQMTDTGTIQNVHYGDILTKYGFCLDMSNTVVPYLLETVSVKKYSESSYARNGDVIIADTAEDNTVGKCVELVNVRGKVLSGQHTMLCRPKVTFAPRFLGYYMNAECFHNQMLPFITGIKVSSISKANVSVLVLKYPSLVEEQQAIAQILSDMDSEIEQLEKKLAKYQQIKQGMMQELLTGRIRLVDADSKEKPKAQAGKEKQLKPAHNQHFDDAVMIAGIVNAFYSEKYPLGRKKVQKLLYLVRRKEQADTSAFHKKAAGPYADEVRYKGGEPIAQKNRYIQVKKSDKGSSFEKGVKIQQALIYLQEWKKQADIDWLLSEFQYTGVNELELLATVDMAMCDLYMDGKEVSVTSIKNLIRSSKEWQDKLKKAYFKDADIQRAIKRCQELFEK